MPRQMVEALRVGDPPIEVRLRRDPRARRLVLRVGRTGGSPVLTFPPGLPLSTLTAFLRTQDAWLRLRLSDQPTHHRVGIGSILPFGDGTLTIRAGAGPLRREGDVLRVPGRPETVPVRAGAFLREAARAACAGGVARLAPTVGRAATRLTLRDPRARWGSCTAKGELMFSWRLVLAPTAVLDYVVAHEMAHLREMNHGPDFWALVERLCPDYRTHRDWLRRNGPGLHAWDFTAPARSPT